MIHTILYLVSNSFNSLHMMSVFSLCEKTLIMCKKLLTMIRSSIDTTLCLSDKQQHTDNKKPPYVLGT